MALIEKKKLSDEVIFEIKRMIQNGEIKEGDKLPNQNEFAKQLGVSRTSLREAMSTLASLGIIEKRQKYGTVIKSTSSALFPATHQVLPLIGDKITTIKLIEARELVEVGTAALAAQNATEDQIKEMGVLIDEMNQALAEEKTDVFSQKDFDFHFLIAKASQNQIIEYLYQTFMTLTNQFMQESFITLAVLQDNSFDFHEFHRKIYSAIQKRDAEEARFQMKRHLVDCRELLEKYYETLGKLSQNYKS